MKKLYKLFFLGFGFFVLPAVIISCSGGKNAEQEREDSIRRADSLAAIEAQIEALEQARLDSLRQDSLNRVASKLTFQTFSVSEKVDGVSLQSLDSDKKIESRLKEKGFELTETKKEQKKDYDWTPQNPTFYTVTVKTYTKTIGDKTTVVKLEGGDGYVSNVVINFPDSSDVDEFKSTVKGKLKDPDVYWHEMNISYKGSTVEISMGGGE